MTKITTADLRACGICPQARHWFDKHGLDWRRFVREGMTPEELRKANDQLSWIDRLEVAAKARENG